MNPTPQQVAEEIRRRRTFAIISHPDAGKTTMTEKLLLYGGAIHLAGTVKGRKAARHATSDWMEIEKQRGISVSSSVLQFQYAGHCINILDTPGHQDFSEDTYRTLCAADAAVMMIDGARGVEAQTIKLFQVCRRRRIPIFTFINKMDRAARSPFDLMDELEKVLGIFAVPFNWPIGTDGDFQGLYNRRLQRYELYAERGDHGAAKAAESIYQPADPALPEHLSAYYRDKLREDLELLDMAGDAFSAERTARGEQTPLFFGSALANYGIDFFLRSFIDLAPAPAARPSDQGLMDPTDTPFSAFVFKIQANMNPDHHDRIAFIRINTGHFERDMEVTHVQSGRKVRLTQPTQFMANDREIIQDAYAGDILGLFDAGNYRLGDCLSAGVPMRYEPIPTFAPEFFARVSARDSMKRKQFARGIKQLSEEGAIQVYQEPHVGTETFIIGVVGELQFDVLDFRLRNEYQCELRAQRLPYHVARLVRAGEDGAAAPQADDLSLGTTALPVLSKNGELVLLFESEWSTHWVLDRNPQIQLFDLEELQA